MRDAHRAASAADIEALDAANRRGLAFRATAELALESTAQGEAFLATCRAAWPDPCLDAVGCDDARRLANRRVYAAGCRRRDGACRHPLGCALTAYLQAMAANLMSAGLRLGIVGQTDGQRILAALEPVVGSGVAGA